MDQDRLKELRDKGSNRTPEENGEYDTLVEQANAENNTPKGGDNVSTQGQASVPGQPVGQAPANNQAQPATGNAAPANTAQVNQSVGQTPVNGNAQPGTQDNTEPGNNPGNDNESTSENLG